MPVLSKHLFFQLSRLLLFCILLLGLSQELFALPIKTSILNPEKQVVGQALVYIDYVTGPGLYWLCGIAETGRHSSGTAGLPTQNLKCFSCFWKHLLVSLPHHLLWVSHWFALMDTSMDTKLCMVLNSLTNMRVRFPPPPPHSYFILFQIIPYYPP